jgi:anaerobic magnesium-protoporphyrin IX monomethyl ester cyclase
LESDPVKTVVNASEGALLVGVTVLTGAPIRDALMVTRAVKARHPQCPVVWGGWHPSLFADQCLDDEAIDVAVLGQGEETLRDLVERRLNDDSLAGCPGTVARVGSRIVSGPPRPLRDLNEFPSHDYSLIDVERYFALKGRRQVDYVSSQGCRFRCAFCADPAVFARGWTGLFPERIAEEVTSLDRQYNLDEVAFQDETFFTHAARIDRLADELLRRGLSIAWTATLRADQACRMGASLFEKCVRSGLTRVMVGVESGSQVTLDRLKKDVRLDQVMTAAQMCADHDVGAIFNFIVGFPGEPEDSVDQTLALAKRLRQMHPGFETPIFYYRPYPGNPIADDAGASGYEFPRGLEEWANFDYVAGRGPWISAERWRDIERFKFYARHIWQRGVWRWPLRAASRWRCERDYYGFPIEKALVEFMRPPQQVS